MLCLLLGNIILIGIITAVPLFVGATMQRILQEDLRAVHETENRFPAVVQMRYTFNSVPEANRHSHYAWSGDVFWPSIVDSTGIPPLFDMRSYELLMWSVSPVEPRELPNRVRSLRVVGTDGFDEHINLTHGRMPSEHLVNGNTIEVIAAARALHSHNLLLGELMEKRIGDAEADPDTPPLYVKIVGIYEPSQGSDAFWATSAVAFNNSLLVSPALVRNYLIPNYDENFRLTVTWTRVLDSSAMRAQSVDFYLENLETIQSVFEHTGSVWGFSENYSRVIGRFEDRTDPLAVTILVLQIPVYVMLFLFMYMVTKQILQMDSNDISVLKSRGANRRQIMGIYAGQGLFVGVLSLPAGLGLGVLLCHIIGASNGFLDMVARAALDVEITGTVLLYALAGFVISYLFMLLPVIKLSRVGIVERKRKDARKAGVPIWRRYYLDVLAFGVSIYVIYNFYSQRELMMAVMQESRTFDPLIFLSSSLFVVGAGLLCLRLYPLLVRLVLHIGRSKFRPSVYASMLRVSRSAGGEQFIMLFLVFTVAVGIFSAQAARTINLDNQHRILYLGGSDLMLREHWSDNIPGVAALGPPPERLVYTEPNFDRFTHFEEVDSITRVMTRDASLRFGTTVISDLYFMGVETHSFGETVWFRDDLLMVHINHYLNALSSHPDGVLLSSNFKHTLGYGIGDVVTITEAPRLGIPATGRFTVVGFVDHWPTFRPVETTVLDTGELRVVEQHLAVVNLGHLQSTWGVRPYQIWMRTNTDHHEFIHDFIRENNIRVAEFYDTARSLVEIQTDPIVQSTNGVLTINFIMTLLLCFAGFLIYWILSIKSRLLQFGIFRAIGMSKREITSILLSEQALITVSSILIGGAVGEAAARLFVPLIQLSYTAADQVIPLMIVVNPADYVTLFGLLGIMVAVCIVILAVYTSRVNVSQVLKLGED